jgi:hypothetical protein
MGLALLMCHVRTAAAEDKHYALRTKVHVLCRRYMRHTAAMTHKQKDILVQQMDQFMQRRLSSHHSSPVPKPPHNQSKPPSSFRKVIFSVD